MSSACIGVVVCAADKLNRYFPPPNDPTWVPTEPPFTPDDQYLVDAIRQLGHSVVPVVWGTRIDQRQQVNRPDVLVIRSPWDYTESPSRFKAFAQWIREVWQAGIRLENHVAWLEWLLDKHYLADLASQGVPVVPSTFVAAGASADLGQCYQTMGPLVVKPCVSASGDNVSRLQTLEAALAFQPAFDALVAVQAMMIQPYLAEIESSGEWSMVFVDGQYSHAIHKQPAAGEFLVQAERGGRVSFKTPPVSVQQLGAQVMQGLLNCLPLAAPSPKTLPLYMRIDVIETQAWGPVISECEGVEPELFFRAKP
jgi:glutathione synthase/RimK-type ligase-like ATP-grasp enzyme